VYVAGNTPDARKVEASLTEEGIDYTLASESFVQLGLLTGEERPGV
jgi:hypothetical protein